MANDDEWRAGSYGTGARHWHVYRRVNGVQEQLLDARGRYRWFASRESAQRAADKANDNDEGCDEKMKIDEDVLGVLAQVTIKGKALVLPKLERKLYLRTNEVLTALGGRWDRRVEAHVFETVDPAEAIARARSEGEVQTPQEDGFFATPAPLAQKLVLMADIEPEMTVLEPSAGNGALVKAIYVHAFDPFVVAIEPDKDRWKSIVKVAQADRFESLNADFLNVEPPYLAEHGSMLFDRVVMNPPFARQQDIQHVTHALKFLKPGGILVAVMSAGVKFREDRRAKNFRALVTANEGTIEELPEHSFRESGTDVRTVVVKMRRAAKSEEVSVRTVTDGDTKEPLTVDSGAGNSLPETSQNDLQGATTMTTTVVSGNGAGKSNGHAKAEAEKVETKVETKAKPEKPVLPDGLTVGGTLFKCNPKRPKIGDFDPGCTLADTDPLKNLRRTLSTAELEIEALAASLDATSADVITSGVMRGDDLWIHKGARRTIAARLVNERRAKDGRPPLNYYVILESGDPQKLAASGFADDYSRLDTPPMMQAKEFERWMRVFGWKHTYIASITGKTPQTVKNILSLLKLSPDLQAKVESGELNATVAYKLATAKPEKQAEAMKVMESTGGKMRAVDAVAAVARVKAKEPKKEPKAAKAKGGKEKSATAKPAQKPTGTAPQHVAPTASQWRKLLAAIERGEKGDAESGDGVILPKDPDFVNVRKAIKEDPMLVIRVAAGDVGVSRIPGLKKCFKWVGVDIG